MAVGLLGLGLFAGPSSQAVPTLYSYDDSGSDPTQWFHAGSGTFCLDVGNPLGDYAADEVAGGGGAIGAWAGVTFSAKIGFPASLTISNLVGAAISQFPGALTGNTVEAGDQASAKWDEFIALAGRNGIVIRDLGPCPVPDAGSTLLLTLGTVFGVGAMPRRSHSREPMPARSARRPQVRSGFAPAPSTDGGSGQSPDASN